MARKRIVKTTPKKESHKVDMVTITMPLCLLGEVVSRGQIEVGNHTYNLDLRFDKQSNLLIAPTFRY